MSRGDLDPIADAVGEYWDALLAGRLQESSADLDPSLIDTIHRLRALDDARAPDPTFVNRLEHEMLGSNANAVWLEPVLPAPWTFTTPNGHRTMSSAGQPHPRRDRRRWALAQLATAALVLLTLLGSFVAFRGPLRLMTHDEQPAVIPAIDGTPEATLPPGVTADTILFQHILSEIPGGADWAGVERTTLAPGAVMKQGTPSDAGVGPYLYRVEAGTVTGQIDGSITVTRAGMTQEESISPEADVVLNTGDVAFVPPGVASHWRNTGSAPATILDTGVSTPGAVNGGDWVDGTLLSFDAPIDAWPIKPPPALAELSVHELTLAPDASLTGAPEPGLKLVGVESGTLTIFWANRADPTVQTGMHELPAGAWMDVNAADFFAKELRNDGSAPLVLLLMTVTPVEPTQAAPLSSALAPGAITGASEDTILMQGTFDAIPHNAGVAGIERYTLAPGATYDLGADKTSGEGPMLFRVEAGELTINADGPLTVTRADQTEPGTIQPNTDVVLRVNDQCFAPAGVVSHWRNGGQVPVVILHAGITTAGSSALPAGVNYADVVYEIPMTPPDQPFVVTVRRVTLPARASFPVEEVPGLELLGIESGQLEAFDAGQAVGTANPLDTQPTGQGLRIIKGSSVLHTFRTGRVFRSIGPDPTTLLLLTITAAGSP